MKCAICGKESDRMPYQDINGDYYCSSKCHEINFWNEVLEDPDTLVINGEAYTVGPENKRSPYDFRGFGGRHFTIKKNDGTIIETTNLWHRGEIPEDRFTGNNAEFVK